MECWAESDPGIVPCTKCNLTADDGAEGICDRMRRGANDAMCDDCARAQDARDACVVCGKYAAVDKSHAKVGGVLYCIRCYDEWRLGQDDEDGSSKRARVGESAAAVANTRRHEKNMALLRE